MNKILITGATGHLGFSVLDEIIRKRGTKNVSVLVRNLLKAGKLKEKGVNLINGDYNDYNSLVKAFKGIDKLYFVSGSDVFKRKLQHENVVNAAKTAKVGHIIYTSFQRKTDDDTSPIALLVFAHVLTEKLIRESGLTYTIMKHAPYSDGVPAFIGNNVFDSGVIFLPAGNGNASFTSRKDMASAGVEVLLGEGHKNKTYEISADKSYTFYEIAEILTKLSGKQIHYAAPDAETFSTALLKSGIPKENIQALTTFCMAIARGEFDFPDDTLEKLIGRKPESLKDLLKNAYKL